MCVYLTPPSHTQPCRHTHTKVHIKPHTGNMHAHAYTHIHTLAFLYTQILPDLELTQPDNSLSSVGMQASPGLLRAALAVCM